MNPPEPGKCEAAVVIGASVGAIDALRAILPHFPKAFPLAVIVVVHIPPDRKSLLSDIFSDLCQLPVKEAEDKEPIFPGTIYFAPPNYHLLVEPDFAFSLSSDPPVRFSRPSIDVLFESAADAFGDSLTAVVLTGGNDDGTAGLKAVCKAGGRAYVQKPSSAEGSIMPSSALAACPDATSATLAEISSLLNVLTAS